MFFVPCVGQVRNSSGVHLLMEMSLCLLLCLSSLLLTSLSPAQSAPVIALRQPQVARSQQTSVGQQTTGTSVPAGTSPPPAWSVFRCSARPAQAAPHHSGSRSPRLCNSRQNLSNRPHRQKSTHATAQQSAPERQSHRFFHTTPARTVQTSGNSP